VKNLDAILHVRGESRFVDDEPVPENVLYAAVVASPVAHGRLLSIEVAAAGKLNGVRAAFTSRDIPGANQIGNVIQDEPLLATEVVHCVGQPVALVVATTEEVARRAARLVKLNIEPMPAVFCPREAYAKGQLIAPQRTFAIGDVDRVWTECDVVVSGRVDSGAQEHVYLETQGAVSLPTEDGGLRVLSSTQAPTAVQRIVARVLALPMHKVEVDVRRLGGGFGGKEDQAVCWAALTALAAWKLDQPVKLVLRRQEDMRWTGKRHPYSSDFKIGLKKDGRIVAYEVFFYQNSGCSADLSTAILERTLFHTTNAYFVPNVRATAACCRTNLPSNTAFRGFGSPQAMFVMESAIYRAAAALGIEPSEVQRKNLLKEGDELPYGMRFQNHPLRQGWEEAERHYDVAGLKQRVAKFNTEHRLEKKGVALMPVCFGISFTTTFLNQASALVHVYTDGSVSVSTAAVEMGQGTSTKIRQVAATTLSIGVDRVHIESTNTGRIANTSPTSASSGPDLNGHATRLACLSILGRLKEVAAHTLKADRPDHIEIREERVWLAGKQTDLDWLQLVGAAYLGRTNLSAHAHYATPKIHFDKATEKGEPFLYHATGTAVVEATVDCLRGTCRVDAVRVVHDAGRSINTLIDRGQVEGGILQGIGWMTMEEIEHDDQGRLRTDTLSTYKVPDIYSIPDELVVHFVENSTGPAGILGAKTVGEPPFMYGIGAYFAVLNALHAYRPQLDPFFNAPLTSEKVLMTLYK
jgi:xanthine dehydrogenase large subunit